MTDIWVCANCRSVNNLRAKQCYNCRTPKDRAAVDPAQIDGTTKGQLREIELPEFQSPRPFAILAAALIAAVAVVQAVNSVLSVDQVIEQVDEFGFAIVTIDTVSPLALPTYLIAGAALVAFAVWLSRAVGSMPALGLGYPAATSTTAFLEVFIPGLNLMRIPAILRDMIRRLEPQEGRGDVMIYAAWIGLFGGLLLPRVGLYLGLFGANTTDSGAQTLVIVRLLSTLLVMAGAIFLVALIWWLEGRIAGRRVAQLAGVPAPTLPTDVAPSAAAGLGALPPGAEVSFRPGAATPVSATTSNMAAQPAGLGGASAATALSASVSALAGPRGIVPVVAPSSLAASPLAQSPSASPPPVARPAPATPTPSLAAPHAPLETPFVVEPATPPVIPPAPETAPPAVPGTPDPVLARPITAAAGRAHVPSDEEPLAAARESLAAEGAQMPDVAEVAETPTRATQPAAAGPHLRLVVADDGAILASLDGSEPEPTTVEELKEAAVALGEAGGSVSVLTGSEAAGVDVAAQLVTAFDEAGVPTTVEPPA